MFIIGMVKIRSYEKGLLFMDREFTEILDAGRRWFFDPLGKVHVDVVSQRAPWLAHPDLDAIIKTGKLGQGATVIDVKDAERALVWIDGRFDRILGTGTYAAWNKEKNIRVEMVDAREDLFKHTDFNTIIKSAGAKDYLDIFEIEDGHRGVLFRILALIGQHQLR